MRIHVIGSGIIGLTTAYYLVQKGHQVTVVEKEAKVANGASLANGGQLSYCFSDPLGKPNLVNQFMRVAANKDPAIKFSFPRSFREIRWLYDFAKNCTTNSHRSNQKHLAELSLSSKELLSELQHTHNLNFDYRKSSKIALYEDMKSFEYEKESLKIKEALGNDSRSITIDEARSLEPAIKALKGSYVGAIYSESDEVGDTYLFCKGLKTWLKNNGTTFIFNQSVEDFIIEKGQVIGLKTENLSQEVERVVVCAGSLTNKIFKIPHITSVRGYSITLPEGEIKLDKSLTLTKQKILFTKLGDKIRITGFADFFSNSQQDNERISELLTIAEETASDLADYGSKDILKWSGNRPQTPSSIPYIGPTSVKGLYINSGHGFYGWTLSFASGKKIAKFF